MRSHHDQHRSVLYDLFQVTDGDQVVRQLDIWEITVVLVGLVDDFGKLLSVYLQQRETDVISSRSFPSFSLYSKDSENLRSSP
jgi:hypothetical protein